jgi:murein DD-endopeptidase MepM/ murein hydrolase activator NlpD
VRVGQRLKIPRAASAAKAPARTPARASGAATRDESLHVVAPGETLMGIATRAKVPRILIAEANGLTPPYAVKAGQKLLIPRTRRYTVKPGDTGFAIAYKHAVPWSQVAIANGLAIDAAVTPGKELLIPTVLNPAQATGPSPQAAKAAANSAAAASAVASAAVAAATAPAGRPAPRFAWPLEGTMRRGWKSNLSADRHDGIDIVAPRGTAVRAAAGGTVLFAGFEKEQFGNLVIVDHGDGWNTAYGFLSRITVKQGARVAPGERVGLVGDTGRARGNELHFEVRQDGAPIDPALELPSGQ